MKVHGQRQTVTKSFAGWALTTAGPAVTALAVYQIMHHRGDLEHCRFRRTKPKWDVDHGCGHEPGRMTAVVGMQLLAVSVWKWWTSQPKRSARAHALP